MDTTEKFCLRWNDFESNISGALKELREDKDFFDVTLACDDNQMEAHKVIISACSPFFRTILRRNKHEHPLLYLKGVKYADLVSVLNFMYHGEVNVAQEELNSFLAVAEDLKVKGLTQNNSEAQKSKSNVIDDSKISQMHDSKVYSNPKLVPKQPRTAPSQVSRKVLPTNYQHEEDDIQEVVPIKSEPMHAESPASHPYSAVVEQGYPDNTQQEEQGIIANPNTEYGEEYVDYDGYEGMEAGSFDNYQGQQGYKDPDDMGSQYMSLVVDESGQRLWNCDLCNKTNKDKSNIRRHMETHLKVKHPCPQCDKQAPSREALRIHISRNHKC